MYSSLNTTMAASTQQLLRCRGTRSRHLWFGNNIHAEAPRSCRVPPGDPSFQVDPSFSHFPLIMKRRRPPFVCSLQESSSKSTNGLQVNTNDSSKTNAPTNISRNTWSNSWSNITPGKLILWSLPLPTTVWIGWTVFHQVASPIVSVPSEQVMTNAAIGAMVLTGGVIVGANAACYCESGALISPNEYCKTRSRTELLSCAAVGGLTGAIYTAPLGVLALLFDIALALFAASGSYVLLLIAGDMVIGLLLASAKGLLQHSSRLKSRQASQRSTPADSQSEGVTVTLCDHTLSELKEFDKLLANSRKQ